MHQHCQMRQERVRELRGIISDKVASAGNYDVQRGQKLRGGAGRRDKEDEDSKESGEERHVGGQDGGGGGGGDGDGSGGRVNATNSRSSDTADVETAASRSTKQMNEYLWNLGERRLRAGFDTSRAPSADNHVCAAYHFVSRGPISRAVVINRVTVEGADVVRWRDCFSSFFLRRVG